MLANEYDTKLIEFPVGSQPKLDGMRCNVKQIGMRSRDDKPIISAPHIFDILKPLFDIFPTLIIDGELYNHELKDDFNEIISLVRKTKPTKEDLELSKESIQYHVYDLFFEDEPDLLFEERMKIAKNIIGGIHESIIIVQTLKAKNQQQLDKMYDLYLNKGYEGQMIRTNTPYQQKRTNQLLKRKEMLDDEFEITDITEGKGNRAKMAGNVYVKLKNGNINKAGISGGVKVNQELWNNKQNYIGKQATIQYQGYTVDGYLRFPVFKSIRYE